VGHAISYPKKVLEAPARQRGKTGRQYRYTCPQCGAEYLHETAGNTIEQVPQGADFRIRVVGLAERIQVNSPHVLRFWGLPLEWQGIELTPIEVRRLQKRAQRIRQRLSQDYMEDEVLAWERFRLTPKEVRRLLRR